MKYRIIWITLGIVIMLFAAFQIVQNQQQPQEAFSNYVLYEGAKGQDVRELQGRLSFLGYYFGQVDGDFGPKTRQAVRNFQYAFGMKVDGVAGPKTKNRLVNATKNWNPSGASQKGQQSSRWSTGNSSGLSQNDIRLMANAVYGEARGEPYIGQVAVAAVILNRVQSESFPNSISGVIFEPRAFTAVSDGQIWLKPNATAKDAVYDAVNGMDPSGGALYYFNPDTATSAWIWSRQQIKTIGKHIFCI